MKKNAYLYSASIVLIIFSLTVILVPANTYAARLARHIVKDVWYSWDTVKIDIQIGSSGRVPEYKYNMLPDNRFYIDIFNSEVENSLNAEINCDDVHHLRRAQNSRNTSRVVIHFNKKGIKPSVQYVRKPTPHILVSWAGSSTTGGVPNKSSGKKYRIMLDPGHGGKGYPGTVGPVYGLLEKEITLDTAFRLEKMLKLRDDVEVELTRRSDVYLSLSERKEKARRWKADLFISIHANGNDNARINERNRTEIYYYDNKGYVFGKTVLLELLDELERPERGGDIRQGRHLGVLKRNPAKYGAVLVESCYLSSKQGENFLRQPWYREEIAKGLNNAIDSFIRKLAEDNNSQ